MDKSILIQYNDIQAEIRDLEKRIEKEKKKDKKIEHDMVRGSSDSFPYTQHNFNIEGVSYKNSPMVIQYKASLKKFKIKLIEKINDVEEYIQALEDSRIRQILRYKYIDNLNWIQIGHNMKATADSIRMEYNRFFDKI
jgi:ERCC4-type nuclease